MACPLGGALNRDRRYYLSDTPVVVQKMSEDCVLVPPNKFWIFFSTFFGHFVDIPFFPLQIPSGPEETS